MGSYKQTLVTLILFLIIVAIGTTVFAALEHSSYQDSFSLSLQIVTTVGYGNVPPKTNSGKVFCIFYTMIGIPVNLVLLQKLGEHMMNVHKFVISKFEAKVLKREPTYVEYKSLIICLIGITGTILLGAFIQYHTENWSYLDGVYCYVITFTTVGFGDFIPGYKADKPITRVVMSLFNLFGLCVMATTINSVLDCSALPKKIAAIFTRKKCEVDNEGKSADDVNQNNDAIELRSIKNREEKSYQP